MRYKEFRLKYLGRTNDCISLQPDGTLVVDTTFGIIEKCNSKCSSCRAVSSDNSDPKCTKCKDGKYVKPDGTCVTQCDNTFYQDDTDHKCINCRTEYPDTTPYKDSSSNQCIAAPTDRKFHIVNNETGEIIICGISCFGCDTAPTDTNDN